jgi:hypothetical protein
MSTQELLAEARSCRYPDLGLVNRLADALEATLLDFKIADEFVGEDEKTIRRLEDERDQEKARADAHLSTLARIGGYIGSAVERERERAEHSSTVHPNGSTA